MSYKLLDFKDIIDGVMEELKLQTTDTVSKNRIKRDINMIYLHEVVPVSRWRWLQGQTTIKHKSYYGAGTASIDPDDTTVTLSGLPSAALGSFANYLFSADGQSEIYKIESHTAGSDTFELATAYINPQLVEGGFKIWSEDIALPADCRETTEVRHDRKIMPMEALGPQRFREMTSTGPKAESRPAYYSTQDYFDPTPLDDETESDRYRLMKVYPSISTDDTLLHIDYIKDAVALEDDGDEPVMAVEDRIVLLYGALSRAWARERNPEEAARNRSLFEQKLARMMGEVEDTLDKPSLQPDSIYISGKRGPRILGKKRGFYRDGSGGGSTYTIPTYLKDTTIEGANLTADMTANAGVLIDGRDVSVDGASLDAHIAASAGVHGVTGDVVGTTDTQTLTNKSIDADLNTITNIDNDEIKAAAGIERSKLAAGTASHVVINDGSGNFSSEERLDLARTADAAANNVLKSQGVGSDPAYGKVTNNEVDGAAAIALTKLATVTASRALESDGSGNIVASDITADELASLDDVEKLTTVALADNTTNGTVATWADTYDALVLTYSVERGSGVNKDVGQIFITHDGTSVGVSPVGVSIGATGVTFDGIVGAGTLTLRYTSTSTGNIPTMKYTLRKWAV